MIKFNVASINCNPDYQTFEIKNLVDIEELISIIKEAKDEFGIEGVTYSGGEPTLQSGLFELTSKIKALGLGVISFTGNNFEKVQSILGNCDMVLDGPFDCDNLEDKRKLLGSMNQRIVCLTDRYKDALEWFVLKNRTNEVNIAEKIIINGDKI